jgi:hypothetical protein
VTSDRRVARCGGGLFRTRAGLVRVAQDCSTTYGENLNLLAVDEISESTYSEHLLREHLYPCDRPWNRLGTHHLSYVPFRARTIVAVDGRQSDYYLHRARGLALRAVGR